MKFLLVTTLIGFLGVQISAKNLPTSQPRTYGNFKPELKKSFQIFNSDEQVFLNGGDRVADAVAFLVQKIHSKSDVKVARYHTSAHNGVTHVYLQQYVNGIEVVNGVGNINIGPKGQILSYGSSFFDGNAPASVSRAKTSVPDALRALTSLIENTEGELNKEFPATLKYIQVNDGNDLVLAWDFVFETKNNMYNVVVNAMSNDIVQLVDWVSDASYNVFPLGINDPESGDRVIVKDPANPVASPLGWHSQDLDEHSTLTLGNNVYAQENLNGRLFQYLNNYRPDGGEDLVFDHPIDLTKQPIEYLDAAITNLFYWNNIIHDLFYIYGFNEEAGNFQDNNFGRGGREKDSVYAQAQDGSGIDNANFMAPPDGSQGRMRMYLWSQTNPYRDGDLDGGIIMHEYLHGISIRLTGGPHDSNCLLDGEGGGMGEGWGDIFATITRVTSSTTRDQVYEMGDYSAGGNGIRNYPYSTDKSINPSTYSYVTRFPYTISVHAKGEVWAVILYEVFWNLVEKHGFDPDWFNNNAQNLKTDETYRSIINGQDLPRPKRNASLGGNIIFFQLLVDGMKLQPCNPTFVEARDAIIQADQINNGGQNECDLWKGFAVRGLGFGARYNGIQSFDVPAKCQ